MKLSFTDLNGRKVSLSPEVAKCDSVSPPGWKCAECGGVVVHGCGRYVDPEASHDTYAARAKCAGCGKEAGILRAVVNTLFGIAEDEAVCGSYCKVY